MNYSSLAEFQQQQFRQPQSDQHVPYDYSQSQAYEAYSAYEQHYDAYPYQQQPYYSHDYSSPSTVGAYGGYYPAPKPDAASVQVDGAHIHRSGLHGVAYALAPEQDRSSYQVPPGMSPAAAAALTQLSHLAGSIDAAERAMAGLNERKWVGHGEGMMPMQAQQHYSHSIMTLQGASILPGARGVIPCTRGGRRGGGLRRGRGRSGGHMAQLPPTRDVEPFPSRTRGRGRGRQFHHPAPETEQLQSAAATAPVPPFSAPKPQQSPVFPVAWCDLCRVDCNSKEILEQHKNGKRHKRTLQRMQEIQARQMTITGLQLIAAPAPETSIPPQARTDTAAHDGVADDQDLGSGIEVEMVVERECNTAADALQNETLRTQSVGTKRRLVDCVSSDGRRGSNPKKMVRVVARGGNHFNAFERAKIQRANRSKDRPRDRPRVCTVCNATCDTLAVFECHLAGKKHLSRIKRFEGQGTVYGPISVVYIPPDQPTARLPEPVFYGMQAPAALQHNVGLEKNHVVVEEAKETVPVPEANPAACEETSNSNPEGGDTAKPVADVAVTAEDVALPECGDSTPGVAPGFDGAEEEHRADSELAGVEDAGQLKQSF